MNDKNRKPIYIAIVLILIIIMASAGVYIISNKSKMISNIAQYIKSETGKLEKPKPVDNIIQNETLAATPVSDEPSTVKVETIKCELCHKKPENVKQHVDGGKLCINCHGSQVHNIHVGEGTVDVGCDGCHGFPPKVPAAQEGTGPGSYSVCENCHAAPPDSFKPSLGNLVPVHLPRGKYCTNCHGTDLSIIHMAALGNEAK